MLSQIIIDIFEEVSSYLKNKAHGAAYREKQNLKFINNGNCITHSAAKQKSYRDRRYKFTVKEPSYKIPDAIASLITKENTINNSIMDQNNKSERMSNYELNQTKDKDKAR